MTGSTTAEDSLVSFIVTIPGLTYRMVDYWCRQGWITFASPGCGPGSRRGITAVEMAALREFHETYELFQRALDEMKSGAVFADLVRKHSPEEET